MYWRNYPILINLSCYFWIWYLHCSKIVQWMTTEIHQLRTAMYNWIVLDCYSNLQFFSLSCMLLNLVLHHQPDILQLAHIWLIPYSISVMICFHLKHKHPKFYKIKSRLKLRSSESFLMILVRFFLFFSFF